MCNNGNPTVTIFQNLLHFSQFDGVVQVVRLLLRNGAVRLGITQMSAESRTQPGGYAEGDAEELEQFAIHDDRPVGEVAAAVRQAGLQPVFKDWEPFLGR
ncbi:thiazole biosynthesis protein ThiH [Aeromonas hydrophila]|nr:thiazole biosynthesis protein ThiH [Aeromonas hydrophila]